MTKLNDSNYDPGALLDAVMRKNGLRNDAALARLLMVAPPQISKARSRQLLIGPAMFLKCQEEGNMTLPELRAFVPKVAK